MFHKTYVISNVENPKTRGLCSVFCKSSFTLDTFPRTGFVNETVGCSGASSLPPFGPNFNSSSRDLGLPLPGRGRASVAGADSAPRRERAPLLFYFHTRKKNKKQRFVHFHAMRGCGFQMILVDMFVGLLHGQIECKPRSGQFFLGGPR